MRSLPALALLAFLSLTTACKRQPVATEEAKERAADLLSSFDMADAQGATQLTHGFHALENGRWRWAASKFGVTLSPPDGKSAQLELKFTLPASVFDKVGAMTLSATVDGAPLPPEKYSSAGDYSYTREVTVGPGPVTIEFTADKALPPGNPDIRELAVIVTRVGLTPR